MDDYLPSSPSSFALKPVPVGNPKQAIPKDWPHAPVHRLSENGIYIVTAGTLDKQRLLNTPSKLDLVERALLSLAKCRKWQLEAWAVLANHYHFVARGAPDSVPMTDFIRELHSRTASELNILDGTEGRSVWHNFWDTRLTYQYAYFSATQVRASECG
jgi:putative transposase